MPTPSSGQINLEGIFSEINENDYTAQNIDGETNVSFTKLSNGTYNTINTANGWSGGDNTSGETGSGITANPKKISEWRGYDHDEAPAFSFPTPSGGFAFAQSGHYDHTDQDDEGNNAIANTEIQLTFNSNGSHVHKTRDFSLSGTGVSFTTGGSFSTTGTPTILEARWVIVNGDYTIDGGSAEKIEVFYTPGGSLSSSSATVASSTQTLTNQDYTGSYVTITPAIFGGSGSNTQTFKIRVIAQSGSSSGDSAKLETDASTDYVGLQIRANSDNSKVVTFRNNASTNVELDAISYEPPEFSCLLPEMKVIEETRGMVPVSSIVVGERIRARGDLNDSSVEKQWTTVTENSVHTRSGYWNVENGLKITNDHPVWLTDETHSAWVKVEDMRPAITRTYHEGSVDTHYIATDVGHFYTYYENVSYQNPGKRWIVSGNYSPESD